MSKIQPILRTFSSGEVTPRIYLRPDLAAYQNGARIVENMICTPYGPIYRRGGWQYVDTIPGGTQGRLFPFNVSIGDAFVFVVTDDFKLRIYEDLGAVTQPSDNLVLNPSFNAGGDDWTVRASGGATVSFSEGFCEAIPVGGQDAAIQQEITTIDPTNLHRILVGFPTSISKATIRIGTAQGLSDIALFNVLNENGFSGVFTPGAGNAVFWIEVSAEAGDDAQIITAVVVSDTTLPANVLEFTTVWSALDIFSLQVDMPSGGTIMYFVTPGHPAYKIQYDIPTGLWTFGVVTFTSPPAAWTGDNHPGVITFFQGRMWLAATPNQPETFWASKSLDFENFDEGTALADEAFEFSLSDRGRIRWMEGVQNLLIGTENSEQLATSEGGVLKAGDIQVEKQSSFGSTISAATQLGTQVVYISPDGRKLREVGFQWTEESWVSKDLLFFSEHLTKAQGRIIGGVTWSQNPDNLMWMRTADGRLLSATYERAYEVIGWHRHPTQGLIKSVTAIEILGIDTPWILIDREIEGVGGTLFLEKLDPNQYVDSHTVIDHVVPANTVSADWLPNTEVSVLADGAVHPNIFLDGDGDGILNYDVSTALIGLPYKSKLETLPIDFATKTGNIKSSFKRWSKLFVSILTSHIPIINGVRQPTRTPATPMDTKEPPSTQYVETTGLGYDRDGIVVVEEDLPISLEINGIFGEVTYDDT